MNASQAIRALATLQALVVTNTKKDMAGRPINSDREKAARKEVLAVMLGREPNESEVGAAGNF